jgi:hypothetical protein
LGALQLPRASAAVVIGAPAYMALAKELMAGG